MNQESSAQAGQARRPAGKRAVLGLVLPVFFLHRRRLALGLVALIAVDFLQLTIPHLLKIGVDGLADGTATTHHLLAIGGLILLIALAVAMLRFVWRYLIIGFSRLLERNLRNRIFSHILTLDRSFFEQRTTGDIMAHASNDLLAVQMACGMGLVAAVDALVMSCAAIGFMVHIHLRLTLLALLPMPLLALCTRLLSARLHQRFNIVQEQFSLLTEFVRTTLVSIRLVKAYTMENLQERDFEQLGRAYVHSNIRVATIQGLLFPVAGLVGNMGMLLVLYFGGRLVIGGRISLGDFVAFITYLYMLVWPMMAIGWVTNLAQRGMTSLGRIHELLSSSPRLQDLAPAKRLNIAVPGFRLRDLSFAYPATTHPALRHISLDIGPGILGLTGRTGSGKSTLCKLLARLYPVADGCLFFAGSDVNSLSLDAVRSRIGYVGQETVLFSDTVAVNIAMGRPGACRAEIEEAARQAAVHDEILRFSQGYETIIGERGVKLSGGQRQRLALARALLCRRPVLIIDDALSALDVETEYAVIVALRQGLRGKTVLIVSQRIKLLSETDEIVIMEQGTIVDRGGHAELFLRNALYRFMHEKQLHGPDAGENNGIAGQSASSLRQGINV